MVSFFEYEMELGGPYLDADLRDSSEHLDDPALLRHRLEQDGYLLIRKLRAPEQVDAARLQILKKMQSMGMLESGTELIAGVVNTGNQGQSTTGVRANEDFRRLPAVQALFARAPVMDFFDKLLGGPSDTFDFQWMRVAGPGAASTIHSDIVFMGRGTQQLYTCWTPIGDVSVEMGPVVLCLGSDKIDALRETYWKADVDRDLIEGYFSKDPMEMVNRFGCKWSTTEFSAGDVLIFGMHILHASLANKSNRYRLSVDARYQLATEPFDERWKGPALKKHYNYWRSDARLEPVAVSRARWGL